MPEDLYKTLALLIPGIFLITWLLRIVKHRKNHFLYTFALFTLISREFQVILWLFAPNSKSSEFIDKLCLILHALLLLGLVSIVRVRMPLKIEEDDYYTFQDDLKTIKCFLNGEREQAIYCLIWVGTFSVITLIGFTRYELVSEAMWGLFTSVSYFLGMSILNNLDRVNVGKEISDQVDLILLLYGLLGIVSFIITSGNHSYPEVITILRLGFYFFEGWACHFYAGMIQNFEVVFENFTEAKENPGESTCEPEIEQESKFEHDVQIEMREFEVKIGSIENIEEVVES